MKNHYIETYKKDNIEKTERINRDIARKIEEEYTFNSYRFDPTKVNYFL